MKKHIEFLGLPGSGKTTVYRAFLQASTRRKIRAYSLDEAFYHALKECRQVSFLRILTNVFPFHLGHRLVGRFPKTTDDLLYQAFQKFLANHQDLSNIVQAYQVRSAEDSQDLGLMTFLWLLELFSKYQFIHDELRDESSLVLDEGFCQRIISLFAYTSPESKQHLNKEIIRYLDHIPLPDVLIIPRAPLEFVQERMEARGYPLRMRTMTQTQRTLFLERAQECVDSAVTYLQQKPVDIIGIDNVQSRAECVRKVPEILPRIYRQVSSPFS